MMKRSIHGACALIVVGAGALALGGCAGDGPLNILHPPEQTSLPPGPARVVEQLAPVKVRVHPLSRVEREPGKATKVICHLELTDQFGVTCKWLGRARVELYRPVGEDGGVGSIGSEKQDLIWEQDLNDAKVNNASYDWVSRTYVLSLGDVPAWVDKIDQGKGRDPWLTLKAYFIYVGVDGQEKTLSASFRIARNGR
jgi:hypothetical protein